MVIYHNASGYNSYENVAVNGKYLKNYWSYGEDSLL